MVKRIYVLNITQYFNGDNTGVPSGHDLRGAADAAASPVPRAPAFGQRKLLNEWTIQVIVENLCGKFRCAERNPQYFNLRILLYLVIYDSG